MRSSHCLFVSQNPFSLSAGEAMKIFRAALILTLPVCANAQAIDRLYVSNETSRSISVIDTRTNSVVQTIPLGQRARGISVSPDGRRVYVALSDDVPMRESAGDRIAVIDAAS